MNTIFNLLLTDIVDQILIFCADWSNSLAFLFSRVDQVISFLAAEALTTVFIKTFTMNNRIVTISKFDILILRAFILLDAHSLVSDLIRSLAVDTPVKLTVKTETRPATSG